MAINSCSLGELFVAEQHATIVGLSAN
jgi:hypothetical protein